MSSHVFTKPITNRFHVYKSQIKFEFGLNYVSTLECVARRVYESVFQNVRPLELDESVSQMRKGVSAVRRR